MAARKPLLLASWTLGTAVALAMASQSPVGAADLASPAETVGHVTRQPGDIAALVAAAVSGDSTIASSAIKKLRGMGPEGLQALFDANAQAISDHERQAIANPSAGADATWTRLSGALDAVAAQRDAFASDLYWYTDLDAAKAAAKASGKPILSLRLLGRLDEELSCANSRFFRTVLYANAEVSKRLREQFVLHWQSERPVPKITIDFGDGRKIERTLTGNSIHYVLNADGRVIDAIPGLYGPGEFLRQLGVDAQIVTTMRSPQIEGDGTKFVKAWNNTTERRQLLAYQQQLATLHLPKPEVPATGPAQAAANQPPGVAPAARVAARVAVGKSVVELPLLAAIQQGPTPEKNDSDPLWTQLAALHAADAQLDGPSLRLMAIKHHASLQPTAAGSAPGSPLHGFTMDASMTSLVENFQRSLALDTVRNEYLLHTRIHHWLATDESARDMETLNTRVYAELFLTPRTDPWLGLAATDAYSALDNEGLCPTPAPTAVSAEAHAGVAK